MLIPELFYSARGTPLSAYHRIQDLMEMGHDVEVLTYKPGSPAPNSSIPVYRAKGPHFATSIKQGPSYLKIWFDLLLFLNLIYRLLVGRYHLLYAHEEGGFLGALTAPLFRVPLVYDMHSSLPLQLGDWSFSRNNTVVAVFKWIERFTLRRARAVVSISPGVTDAAKRAFPAVRAVTIFNRFSATAPVSSQQASQLREDLGITSQHKMVLYTGSFVALQSLDLLIHSVPHVVARLPNCRFVLVGGRESELNELTDLSKKFDVSKHVILIATRPEDEMPVYMAASDVLVSPRIRGINPPGKLFSYLSSGKPLVATRCPIHTQILSEDCSILTEPTPEEFAAGIVRALTDADLSTRIQRAAQEVLRTTFSPQVRAESYARVMDWVSI